MFRVSQFMHEIVAPTPAGPRRDPPGPVVIWNLIRRCNLTCKHCYSVSADRDFAGELSTAEVYGVIDDLRAFLERQAQRKRRGALFTSMTISHRCCLSARNSHDSGTHIAGSNPSEFDGFLRVSGCL